MCAPQHLYAPPFPPLASLPRRTPPPLGALRVPQRPAAAVYLPLPLLLRPAADRHIARSAVSTCTIARACCPPYRPPRAPFHPSFALSSPLLVPADCHARLLLLPFAEPPPTACFCFLCPWPCPSPHGDTTSPATERRCDSRNALWSRLLVPTDSPARLCLRPVPKPPPTACFCCICPCPRPSPHRRFRRLTAHRAVLPQQQRALDPPHGAH